jgi:DNA-directed RNA polymerase subunit M/transcription elongation factor TFIIS
MLYECPKCGGMMVTHKKIERRYGLYIQWRCKDCNHRESQTDKGPPRLRPYTKSRRNGRLFDDATIAEIRASTESRKAKAATYGCSVETISRIERGIFYKEPVEDATIPSCRHCRFWDFELERCKEGWPDPLTDGPSYAKECIDFSYWS